MGGIQEKIRTEETSAPGRAGVPTAAGRGPKAAVWARDRAREERRVRRRGALPKQTWRDPGQRPRVPSHHLRVGAVEVDKITQRGCRVGARADWGTAGSAQQGGAVAHPAQHPSAPPLAPPFL